jgi:hypothetical protein
MSRLFLSYIHHAPVSLLLPPFMDDFIVYLGRYHDQDVGSSSAPHYVILGGEHLYEVESSLPLSRSLCHPR